MRVTPQSTVAPVLPGVYRAARLAFAVSSAARRRENVMIAIGLVKPLTRRNYTFVIFLTTNAQLNAVARHLDFFGSKTAKGALCPL